MKERPECIKPVKTWHKEIQVCANEVPGGNNLPNPRGHSFLYAYITKSIDNVVLVDYWSEYILNWNGASLGHGD